MKTIIEQTEDRICILSLKELEILYEKTNDIPLNNVLIGIDKECFGILYFSKDQYELFYVLSTENGTNGYLLKTGLKEKKYEKYTMSFCQYLTSINPKLNEVDVFNDYQYRLKVVLEKDNYRTHSKPLEIPKNAKILYHFQHPSILVPFINKLDYYRSIFRGKKGVNNPKKNKVYLMLNLRSNFVKIGKSIKPQYREKTLQGEEPEIRLLASWEADSNVEKSLHQKYKLKRNRGEWFSLSLADLWEIKKIMTIHKQIKEQ